eukprot:3219946-Pleurochrysis_carterae.AAC.1
MKPACQKSLALSSRATDAKAFNSSTHAHVLLSSRTVFLLIFSVRIEQRCNLARHARDARQLRLSATRDFGDANVITTTTTTNTNTKVTINITTMTFAGINRRDERQCARHAVSDDEEASAVWVRRAARAARHAEALLRRERAAKTVGREAI